MTTKEEILTFDDGSCYIGEVKNGKKHGYGVLSTCALVYGVLRTSSDNAHLAKWNEYRGIWVDDKMHGYGKMIRKCFNGDTDVLYDGIWVNGTPPKETTTEE